MKLKKLFFLLTLLTASISNASTCKLICKISYSEVKDSIFLRGLSSVERADFEQNCRIYYEGNYRSHSSRPGEYLCTKYIKKTPEVSAYGYDVKAARESARESCRYKVPRKSRYTLGQSLGFGKYTCNR